MGWLLLCVVCPCDHALRRRLLTVLPDVADGFGYCHSSPVDRR